MQLLGRISVIGASAEARGIWGISGEVGSTDGASD